MSNFKELNLDKTRLKDSIKEFCENNNIQLEEYREISDRNHRVTYKQNDCEVKVDLFFGNNGTTTINPKIGKHHDKGEQLANYLKESLVDDHRKNMYLTLKDIDAKIFDDLLAFFKLLEDSISIQSSIDNATQKAIKAQSKYNDSLTLTHYKSTNKLLIQGKPLYTYNQVSYFLSEFTDLDGFISIVNKGEESSRDIDVDKKEIEQSLKRSLPNAYEEVGEGILRMLDASYTLKDIHIPLKDYSCSKYRTKSLKKRTG